VGGGGCQCGKPDTCRIDGERGKRRAERQDRLTCGQRHACPPPPPFPHIAGAWNGTATQSGRSVTATNAGYHAAIPAGGDTSFGFQGTWNSSDAAPTAFTLNGAACT